MKLTSTAIHVVCVSIFGLQSIHFHVQIWRNQVRRWLREAEGCFLVGWLVMHSVRRLKARVVAQLLASVRTSASKDLSILWMQGELMLSRNSSLHSILQICGGG